MNFWTYISTHWKTGANGILAFLITTGTVVVAYTATKTDHTDVLVTTAITLALALCRAWVGLLEKDADKITAKDVQKATAKADAK